MRFRNRALAGGLALLAALQGAPAWAQEVKLDAAGIVAAIAGNTVAGTWDGMAYRQYFDPAGTSIIERANGETYTLDWHIDPETNAYCSYHWWRGTRCYEAFLNGTTLRWTEQDSDLVVRETLIRGRHLFSASQ